jgi:hypothetical protein
MLFKTYDPYNDEINNNNNKYLNKDNNTECFICFEINDFYHELPIQLHNQTIYLRNCICNGAIHSNCLYKWVDITNKCPICREEVVRIINNKIFQVFAYLNPTFLRSIILNSFLLIKIAKRVFKYIFMCMFFYYGVSCYLYLFNLFFFYLFYKNKNLDSYIFDEYNNYMITDYYYYENNFLNKNSQIIVIYNYIENENTNNTLLSH